MNGYASDYLEAAVAMFRAMGATEERACKCAAYALASEIDRAVQQHGSCGASTLQARAAELRLRTQGLRAEDRHRHAAQVTA
ncbi:hypothetical protein [Thioalkalivibrio sp. ALE6]|uniref:hypothetical protein n=1 Tax=Thioalkalivibrio sp. ALE6 TaxID=1266908 RepID=UPI00036E1345|nr:hypothetical protein [Thioalkalivibrio sp. ALE6]